MIKWFLAIGIVYAFVLVYIALRQKRVSGSSSAQFLFGGSNFGVIIGFLTFSASLFSTFTLQGMPNFFKTHGIGSWIFLGVTDVFMAFVLLYFGLKLRKLIKGSGTMSTSAFLANRFGTRLPSGIFMITVFIFLIPYVAIQLKGVGLFLNHFIPLQSGVYIWPAIILVVMLLYSGLGGFRAIVYSDAIQGTLLLVVVWIVAILITQSSGGMSGLFQQVTEKSPELLTLPGPKGLLTLPWLFSSFIAIILMPITQPHLFIRMMIIKSHKKFLTMVLATGIFAFLVIIPTIFIGLFGAINYPDANLTDFLTSILTTNIPAWLGALFLVGLLAAAMSTADSILFSLGVEITAWPNKKIDSKIITKVGGLIFAVLSYFLAIQDFSSLVLLARVSFAGTSLLAPMIIIALSRKSQLIRFTPYISIIGIILYCLALGKIISSRIYGVPVELVILTTVSLLTVLEWYMVSNRNIEASNHN